MPPTDAPLPLRRAAIVLACILLLAVGGRAVLRLRAGQALASATAASVQEAPRVDVAVVRAAPASAGIELPGETVAWYHSTLYARVSGYVAHWYADIGDQVQAGQVLATIDTPELDAELAAAQARLQVAAAQVKIGAADASLAQQTWARWRDSPKGVVSEQERENKQAENASADARLEAARAQVRLDQADVRRLQALSRFRKVTAPYAGTIIQRQIDIGDLVTAGSSSSTTSLFQMARQDPMRIMVNVPQNLARDLMKTGIAARVNTTGDGAIELTGQVVRNSGAIDPHSRTFAAEIDVPNPQQRLVAGQYVKVSFPLRDVGLLQVPAAAVSFRNGGATVAVVTPQNTVAFRTVDIARDDGSTLELDTGVTAGDKVVLNISNQITEGQRVQISTAADAASPALTLQLP